jgi:hypothetical protein
LGLDSELSQGFVGYHLAVTAEPEKQVLKRVLRCAQDGKVL